MNSEKQEKLRKGLAFAAMAVFGIVGLVLTRSTWMYYNFLLFPIAGFFAYWVLEKKWFYAPLGIFAMSYLTMVLSEILGGVFQFGTLFSAFFEAILFGLLCAVGVLIHLCWNYTFSRNLEIPMWRRAITGGLCFSMISFVLISTTSLMGNPFSSKKAAAAVETYIAEAYPNDNLVVADTVYSAQLDEYWVTVKSPTVQDIWFYVSWKDDHIQVDDYENFVGNKMTTILRMTDEANKRSYSLVKDLPLMDKYYMQFDGLDVTGDKKLDAENQAVYDKLELDMPYDNALQIPATVYLSIAEEAPEFSELAAMFESMHKILSEDGFHVVSYDLRYQIGKQTYSLVVSSAQVSDGNLLSLLEGAQEHTADGLTQIILPK